MIPPSVFQNMKSVAESASEEAFQVEWSVPLDLPYLRGHFPGQPVFPAVGIVDASVFALSQRIPRSYLSEVVHAKFLNLIQPGVELKIAFRCDMDGAWNVEWSESPSGKSLATLRLQLTTLKS